MNEHEIPEDVNTLPAFDADDLSTPVKISSVKEGLGMPTLQIKASELIDKTFVIKKARSFISSFERGGTAYFCVCVDAETAELFSTVLGGQGVVELLDLYFASGQVNPLEVTLRRVKGGRYGRYYVLE